MEIPKWEKDIEKLSPEDREKLAAAIDTLMRWNAFKAEFDWTGIGAIKVMLRASVPSQAAAVTASPAAMNDKEYYVCDNCGFLAVRDNFKEAKDLFIRLTPGGIYTDVECPKCAALAFPLFEGKPR